MSIITPVLLPARRWAPFDGGRADGYNAEAEKNTVTLRVDGGGPAGILLAVADGAGHVKGYVQEPFAEVPPRADGKLDVGSAVGKTGMLSVVKDLE